MKNVKNIIFLILLIFIKIQESSTSEDIYETEIIKNKILDGCEKDNRAYYIAYSPYITSISAFAFYIHLPTSLSTNEGKRNAIIVGGILGKYGFLDMGIINSGKGWQPYYNENGEKTISDEYISNEKIKIIGIVIEIFSKNKLQLNLGFREKDNSALAYVHIPIYYSHLYEKDEEGNPIFRIYRYASLVNDEDNGIPDYQNDQTYMVNGKIVTPVIYLNGEEKEWRIGGKHIEACWKMSAKRVEFSYTDQDETFSIRHYSGSLYLNFNVFMILIFIINLF